MILEGKIQELPTLPGVAFEINRLIADSNSSVADLERVLSKDQALTAKVLKLANSSFYAVPGGVTSVKKALGFLGFNTIAQLALGVSVFDVFARLGSSRFSIDDFWKHSLAVGLAAERIAKEISLPQHETAFTAGLLHDLGKLVQLKFDRTRFEAVLERTTKTASSFVAVEREQIRVAGEDHAMVGWLAAKQWNFPATIQAAIRFHHDPAETRTASDPLRKLVACVRIANQIVVRQKLGFSGDCSEPEVGDQDMTDCGLTSEKLASIERWLDADFKKAGALVHALAA